MLCEKSKCSGCGSCYNVCPAKCIEMKKDNEGFFYPHILEEQCVHCSLCEQVCPSINTIKKNINTRAFAANNKNEEIRKKSSSGAVFPELAINVLNQGGYICGAIYDENFKVCHYLSNNKADISKMCGAKYAQSNSWLFFKKIKEYLDNDKKVLFVGTPCQVAGIKLYLKKDYENLYTIDMICHGVPSPSVWEKYVDSRRKKDAPNSKIDSIELRNKDTGWSRYKYSVKFSYQNSVQYSVEQSEDKFMKGFVSNLFLRPSCEKCDFKGIERSSDITLGDYWGIWDQNSDFDDNKGTSLVITHTNKGYNLWKEIQSNFKNMEVEINEAITQNPSILLGSKAHENRKDFFAEYIYEEDVIKLIDKYICSIDQSRLSIWNRLKSKICNRRK